MASTDPRDSNHTLDYQQPRTREADWRRALLVLAPVPFAIEVVLFLHLAVNGDPIGAIGLFRAYHYWAVTTIAFAVAWLAGIAIAFGRTRQLMMTIALAWCLWECWVGVSFLREVRNDKPPGVSWSAWR